MRPDTAEPTSLSAETASTIGLFPFPLPPCFNLSREELGYADSDKLKHIG